MSVSDPAHELKRRPRPLSLSLRHAGIVGLFLFLVLCLWALMFGYRAERFVYERFLAEDLEERFGFRGGLLHVEDAQGQPRTVFGLVEVDPDGPLGRAGFVVGETPWGHMHDNYVYFHKMLQDACRKPDQKIAMRLIREGRWKESITGERKPIPCPDAP
jgi:hypothetical protein